MDTNIDDHHSLSLKSKLPIKRKNPEFPSTTTPATAYGGDPRPPPFKFHRIWTEPDEIRFLHGLLKSGSDKLSFPRDLSVFYTRFSDSMSQPYTKSQLSEKLRRLRKKFRVISTRLAKGLDFVLLSPHDRALYDLSKQLWHPQFSSTSPFSATNFIGNFGGGVSTDVSINHSENNKDSGDVEKNGNGGNVVFGNVGGLNLEGNGGDSRKALGLVGVKVEFLPDLEINCEDVGNGQEYDGLDDKLVFEGLDVEDGVEMKLSEVDVKFEDCIDIGDDGLCDNQGVGKGVYFGDGNGDVESNGFTVFGGGEIQGAEVKVAQNGCANAGGPPIKVKEQMAGCGLNEVGGHAAKIVMNVFNEALEEARKGIVNDDLITGNEQSFEKQWQEQRVAELDVFAKRMRLIIENSLPKV
ncbi:hypothetical protein Leryth_012761 [Lithospermum erythrorhizon]|nr:hypothetical protein Leryth_012761 [Lithospermum erythrorhizon]